MTTDRPPTVLVAGVLALLLTTAGVGAAAAPRGHLLIIGGGERPPELMARFAELAGGPEARIAVVPSAVVDQHFVARKRLNRLIAVVLENPGLLGLGIDESTAILVAPDLTFEVLGRSQVVVLDATQAREISSGAEGHLAGRGIVLHLLRAGERFDLEARRPLPR